MNAVLRMLAPKESKHDYMAIREVFEEIGDGIPVVTVDLRPLRVEKADLNELRPPFRADRNEQGGGCLTAGYLQ